MLQTYLASPGRATIPLPGAPVARLVIDPRQETLSVEVDWDGEALSSLSNFVHLSSEVVFKDGHNWATLTVHGKGFFFGALPMLRSIVGQVQLDGRSFRASALSALRTYQDLLAAQSVMPTEAEIGLFGELLVLRHLIGAAGSTVALRAWRGGDQTEEHDFGLPDGDVEIKTTTSEQRRHWIGSLTQLCPSLDRSLWLLSIQLTGAGAGKAERLPDVIGTIQEKLVGNERADFDARIERAGYRATQAVDTYRLLRLRSRAALFRVEGDFPRIDREVLEVGGADLARIGEASYQILLDGLSEATTRPTALVGF